MLTKSMREGRREGMPVETFEHRGWPVVRLGSDRLSVDVVPGKGGDILSIRFLPRDLELLWSSPWGLRPAGAAPGGGGSVANFLEHYPGGWQTIFPNGGAPSDADGVELGFHGEAALVPWEWRRAGDACIELVTHLARSPFALRKRLTLRGDRLEVRETVENTGGAPVEAMWSHHPAFGAPFLSGACRVDVAARRFVVDDERDVPAGDLQIGAVADWPWVPTRDGGKADLTVVPPDGPALDRLGYLTDLER
ncbi:MAG: aldose 1-epimerase, partial [Actinobacteria bacterium]|nr:aldose 1-epimerase [Actinomycetota bacterium]